MDKHAYLDHFEKLLEDGLAKLCTGAGLLDGEIFRSPDIDDRWDKDLVKPYVADAVKNFNDYPDAALGWAAFLGMAVGHQWDKAWEAHRSDVYESYYGPRGWDDMDEHVLYGMLHLDKEEAARLSDAVLGCSSAARGLIRHEGIEAQTETGFYILARCYTVFYRLGAALELRRLGYKKVVNYQPRTFLKS